MGKVGTPHTPSGAAPAPLLLKIQSAFAGAVGQRFDTPVVEIAAPVENYFADTGRFGALGYELADHFGLLRLGSLGHVLVEGGGGDQRVTLGVVYHLRVDAVEAAEDVQAR